MLMRDINESLLKTEEEREEFDQILEKLFVAFGQIVGDKETPVVKLAVFNFATSIIAAIADED